MSSEYVCFIVCNPYFGKKNELGQAVINDGKLIEKIYSTKGYECITIVDATVEEFKKQFEELLSKPLKDLVIYYSGHGIQVDNEQPDDDAISDATSDADDDSLSDSEEDGKDECLVFIDGLIYDDYLYQYSENGKCDEVFFIFDCCHSGTLADIPNRHLQKPINSISACMDKECSIQTRNNGLFTSYIEKYQALTLEEIVEKTDVVSRKYKQHIQITGCRRSLFKSN